MCQGGPGAAEAVVESGFGSLQPFNILIRSIFIDARATNLESLVVASSLEGTAREADMYSRSGIASMALRLASAP